MVPRADRWWRRLISGTPKPARQPSPPPPPPLLQPWLEQFTAVVLVSTALPAALVPPFVVPLSPTEDQAAVVPRRRLPEHRRSGSLRAALRSASGSLHGLSGRPAGSAANLSLAGARSGSIDSVRATPARALASPLQRQPSRLCHEALVASTTNSQDGIDLLAVAPADATPAVLPRFERLWRPSGLPVESHAKPLVVLIDMLCALAALDIAIIRDAVGPQVVLYGLYGVPAGCAGLLWPASSFPAPLGASGNLVGSSPVPAVVSLKQAVSHALRLLQGLFPVSDAPDTSGLRTGTAASWS